MKPRVLLVGFDRGNKDNQISRRLTKYGVEVVFASADSGKHFDATCDAVFFLKFHLSHARFYEVKDAYKSKKIFSTGSGFSEIAHDFEEWLSEQKPITEELEVQNVKMNTMESAFRQAAPIESRRRYVEPRMIHKPEDVAAIKKMVLECLEAKMSIGDTCEMLASHGFKKASGKDIDGSYVSAVRYNLEKEGSITPPAAATSAPIPATTPKTTKVAKPQNQLELIGQVLASKLPMDRKMDLVEQIQKGLITATEAATCKLVRLQNKVQLQVSSTSIFEPSDKPIIAVDIIQATALLMVLPNLKAFSETGEI